MGFLLNSPFGQPYYLGGSVTQADARIFDTALGGHQYMIDWSADEPLSYAPVPFTRQQADQSDLPGEQTINPEGFWRRSGESWHLGAGQVDYDRKESSFFRFRDSLGIDFWNKWQFGLLNDTEQKLASAESNLDLAVAGSRLYITDGATLSYMTTTISSGSSLRLDNFLSGMETPDQPEFHHATDFRITIRFNADDWTPTNPLGEWLFSQYSISGPDDRFIFYIDTTGALGLLVSADGSTNPPVALSTVATGFADGTDHWLRVTFDGDDGGGNRVTTFETSADGVVWGALGAVVTQAGTVSLFDSTQPLTIGSIGPAANGNVRYFKYEVGGTTVAEKDLTTVTPGTVEITDDNGNLWAVSNFAAIVPDAVSSTAVGGTPATAATDIASNGYHVWTAHAASGIYRTDRTLPNTASHITGTVSVLGFVRNRLLAADANNMYDVTALGMGAGGALPAALFTHANSDFVWVDFADLNGYIYAAGYSGDKSLIYKTAVKADGTALDAPAVAGVLPDGEVITHIRGYLGKFLFIGTQKGWRLAINSDNGDLNIGKLVTTSDPVLCSEGQEEFIYYGLGDFQIDYSGLGRLSTGAFSDIENFVPAYGSDLMASGANANTTAVVTFEDRRVFAVDGVGIYAETNYLVPTGHIDTGHVSYNMTEAKVGVWFIMQHTEGGGGHDTLVSLDGGPFVEVIHHDITPLHTTVKSELGNVAASTFEFRIVINRNHADPTETLLVNSWIFRVQPTSEPTDYIYATVIMAPKVDDINGVTQYMNTYAELDYLAGLRRDKVATAWQQGRRAYTVFLEDFKLNYRSLMSEDEGLVGFNGSCLLKMKVVL